jgi:hypothetical protein
MNGSPHVTASLGVRDDLHVWLKAHSFVCVHQAHEYLASILNGLVHLLQSGPILSHLYMVTEKHSTQRLEIHPDNKCDSCNEELKDDIRSCICFGQYLSHFHCLILGPQSRILLPAKRYF